MQELRGCKTTATFAAAPLVPDPLPRLEFWPRPTKTTRFPENSGCLALPPKAARPKNNYVLENVWFVGLGTPGLPKNTWPNNHFGISLSVKKSVYN